jgi:hypothetical protein
MIMALTCPACNKANQTDAICQRCGCDLSGLHAIKRAAEASLGSVRQRLRQRDWAQALAEAEQSWQLCHSDAAAQCAFILSGILGNTAAALCWRQRTLRGKTQTNTQR